MNDNDNNTTAERKNFGEDIDELTRLLIGSNGWCVCVMKNSVEADFYKVSCSINNRLSRISDKASLTGKVFIGQTMTFIGLSDASKTLLRSKQIRQKYGSLNLKTWLIA